MSITDTQRAQLAAKLDAGHVKQRSQAGRQLSYIEGWHAIAEANRIFGFDGWSRETVDIRCIWEGQRPTQKGPKPAASYIAKVRVEALGIVREGTGAGSGFGNDIGEAHESAVKEAETDAMKRALMTFGNPFGLALYDKAQENVDRNGNGGGHTDPIHDAKQTAITADRHLLVNGDTRSTYEVEKAKNGGKTPYMINKEKQDRRKKAEEWTARATEHLATLKSDRAIMDWWDEKMGTIAEIEENHGDLYQRLLAAHDEMLQRVPRLMKAG